MASALREIRRILEPDGKALLHFLDSEDWRRCLAPGVPPEKVPFPSYRAVVTCFCSKEAISDLIEEAGLKVEGIDLKTNKGERGEQRNWLAQCKK